MNTYYWFSVVFWMLAASFFTEQNIIAGALSIILGGVSLFLGIYLDIEEKKL